MEHVTVPVASTSKYSSLHGLEIRLFLFFRRCFRNDLSLLVFFLSRGRANGRLTICTVCVEFVNFRLVVTKHAAIHFLSRIVVAGISEVASRQILVKHLLCLSFSLSS